MAEKKTNAEPGDVVELADKSAGFTDPDTGFDISRDQKLPLGDTVGKQTQLAVASGGLVIVSGKSAKAEAKADAAAEEKAIEESTAKATGAEPAAETAKKRR
jgi:hypothetical protein